MTALLASIVIVLSADTEIVYQGETDRIVLCSADMEIGEADWHTSCLVGIAADRD